MKTLPPVPKKSLGQCFLAERRYAQEIIAALGIREGDTVIEIGPGRGVLTELLVETPARIIAVEIDNRLQEFLQEKFAAARNFKLVHADFLEYDFSELAENPSLKVVGNLPYHLSSGIVYKLLEHNRAARTDSSLPWFQLGVLMMQKEVADRMVANSGSRTYGKLSVFVQAEANATMHVVVPAEAFRPRPQVDGGVVRLEFLKLPESYPRDYKLFERIVRFTFSQRRKMMKSTLSQLAGVHPFWQQCDFDFTRRPETFSIAEWAKLANEISSHMQP